MELCYGKITYIERNNTEQRPLTLIPDDRPKGIKRKRLTCPECGRRLMSSISWDEDGNYFFHTIPPHKPKMWWKKNKKRKIRR